MDTTTTLTNWPPPYNLRLSNRARHPHLKVVPNQGLEVVIPMRLRKRITIEDLLSEKRAWIEKHLAALKIKPLEKLNNLHLAAINQQWNIEYKATESKTIRGTVHPGDTAHILILQGNIDNLPLITRWLQIWLKQIAREHLLPWLYALSVQKQLPFNKSAIRAQQTLWGSCTAEKNISLNYKLLFVPHAYAEHIMLHELCHTKFLDHSKKFWNLLQKLDPNTTIHNRAMREADKFIPACF